MNPPNKIIFKPAQRTRTELHEGVAMEQVHEDLLPLAQLLVDNYEPNFDDKFGFSRRDNIDNETLALTHSNNFDMDRLRRYTLEIVDFSVQEISTGPFTVPGWLAERVEGGFGVLSQDRHSVNIFEAAIQTWVYENDPAINSLHSWWPRLMDRNGNVLFDEEGGQR